MFQALVFAADYPKIGKALFGPMHQIDESGRCGARGIFPFTFTSASASASEA